MAFLDLGRIVVLALAGAVGFGIGFGFLDYLTYFFGTTQFATVAGIIGGASLGAALGYLERREPAGRRVA